MMPCESTPLIKKRIHLYHGARIAYNFHFKKLMFGVLSLCQSKFVGGFTLMKGYCSKCQLLNSLMVANLNDCRLLGSEKSVTFFTKEEEGSIQF